MFTYFPIAPPTVAMKVEFVDYHAVATWLWDLGDALIAGGGGDDLCGICRVLFNGTCPDCKYPGTECPVVIGALCPHNFHMHCILKWLEQELSRGLCPMCRQIFTYSTEMLGDLPELTKLIEDHAAMRARGPDDDGFEQLEATG